MNLPPEFISTITNTFGEDGEELIANLPALIEEASARWGLTDVQPVANLSYNFVAFAQRRGEVISPHDTINHQIKGQGDPAPTSIPNQIRPISASALSEIANPIPATISALNTGNIRMSLPCDGKRSKSRPA